MTTKQRVLDMWIEKGAVYNKKDIKSGNDGRKEIVLIYDSSLHSDRVGYSQLSPRDILYHPTSNLREVMFPDKTMTKPTIGRKNISVPMHHKMMSLLSDDPREYIVSNSLLFKDDNNE